MKNIHIKDQWIHVKPHLIDTLGKWRRVWMEEQRKRVQLTINCNDVKGGRKNNKKIWKWKRNMRVSEWETVWRNKKKKVWPIICKIKIKHQVLLYFHSHSFSLHFIVEIFIKNVKLWLSCLSLRFLFTSIFNIKKRNTAANDLIILYSSMGISINILSSAGLDHKAPSYLYHKI